MSEVRSDYATRFKEKPGSLARVAISVHLPKDVDVYVRSLPNRSEWLRKVICDAVEREVSPEGEESK